MFTPRQTLRAWCAVLCLFAGTAASAAEILRLRADQWMPFNGDPTAAQPGYVVELARTIFSAKGIEVQYQVMPWADALKAAAADEIEGVIGANTKEAAALVMPAEPIGMPHIGFFVRKGTPWTFTSIPALKKVRLGAIESYSYWEALDAYLKAGHKDVVWFKGETPLIDAIAKLDVGEIDVMPESLPVFIWTVKAQGRSFADYRLAYTQPGEPVYLAFARSGGRGAKYTRIFDEGLRILRKSGALQELLKRYNLEDWAPKSTAPLRTAAQLSQ